MSATFSDTAVLAVFHTVFLGQIFLISIKYSAEFRRRILYVLDNYPPALYPKLYPKPFDANAEETSKERLRFYRNVNYVVAAIGFMILSAMVFSGYRPDVKGGDEIFVMLFFVLQMCALIYPGRKEFKQYRLMREAFGSTTRKADLNPRRLFDFISPVYVATAILLYVAWLVFYLYGKGSSASWEGEVYATVIGITGMNLFYAAVIARFLYGKKRDPYQAYKDKLKEIGVIVNTLFFASIGGSIFLTITQAVDQYGLEVFDPPLASIYIQFGVFIGIGSLFRTLKVEAIDFEAYTDDSAQPST